MRTGMETCYERIVIVGSTRVVGEITDICKAYSPVSVIETADAPENKALAKACSDVPFYRLNKSDIMSYLSSAKERTLVISAVNHYLFPEFIVNLPNLTIINYHSALLPKYPGRNATTWAIWNGETDTGITWHYIDDKVDNGYIITQAHIPISKADTALTIIQKQMKAAVESFKEFIPKIITDSAPRIPLNTNPMDIHLAKEIPNDGIFNLSWDFKTASRFLRCMDFGGYSHSEPLKIYLNGEIFTWKRYAISKESTQELGIYTSNGQIDICYREGKIELKMLSIIK